MIKFLIFEIKCMAWVALAGIILGAVILKSLYDSDTMIHRCPYCGLVILKNKNPCPRCKSRIDWT